MLLVPPQSAIPANRSHDPTHRSSASRLVCAGLAATCVAGPKCRRCPVVSQFEVFGMSSACASMPRLRSSRTAAACVGNRSRKRNSSIAASSSLLRDTCKRSDRSRIGIIANVTRSRSFLCACKGRACPASGRPRQPSRRDRSSTQNLCSAARSRRRHGCRGHRGRADRMRRTAAGRVLADRCAQGAEIRSAIRVRHHNFSIDDHGCHGDLFGSVADQREVA